jgi:acetoin utilization deacetylase AcuC-like enzyme
VALPFQFVYSHRYDLNLGEHVFPAVKYRLVYERLLAQGLAAPGDFVEPEPASDEDVLRVHTVDWVRNLKTGALSEAERARLEIPYSRQMVEAAWMAVGGSILAAKLALRDGLGFNIGGGFHHAFAGHGEGFCPLNDIAVAIRRLQHEGKIRRAMVVDVDVHHGNGTAAIFADDPTVFTLSIHQYRNSTTLTRSRRATSIFTLRMPAPTRSTSGGCMSSTRRCCSSINPICWFMWLEPTPIITTNWAGWL